MSVHMIGMNIGQDELIDLFQSREDRAGGTRGTGNTSIPH